MKVLVVTHGRSGSTNLMYSLAKVFNLKVIIEPFNEDLWNNIFKEPSPYKEGDPIPDNCLFKCVIDHNNAWLHRNVRRFDFVIVLAREKLREVAISVANAMVYGFYNKYPVTENPSNKTYLVVSDSYKKLFKFNIMVPNSKLVWYEDIYNEDPILSYQAIQKIGMGIDKGRFKVMWDEYLNPSKRLRTV